MNLVYEPVWGGTGRPSDWHVNSNRLHFHPCVSFATIRQEIRYHGSHLCGASLVRIVAGFRMAGKSCFAQAFRGDPNGLECSGRVYVAVRIADIPAVKPSRWGSLASWRVNHAAAASQ
jgi:hypothetical protein